jgi:hypothetical protein
MVATFKQFATRVSLIGGEPTPVQSMAVRDIVLIKAKCFSLSTSKGYTAGIKLKSRVPEDAGQHEPEYPIYDDDSSDVNEAVGDDSSDSDAEEEGNGDDDSGSDSEELVLKGSASYEDPSLHHAQLKRSQPVDGEPACLAQWRCIARLILGATIDTFYPPPDQSVRN